MLWVYFAEKQVMTDRDKLKATAEVYFVKLLFNQKETALKTGVSEKTIGDWVSKGKWKEKRDAEQMSGKKRAEDIKSVIGGLTERRLLIFKEEAEAIAKGDTEQSLILKKEAVNIGLEVANFNKALTKLDAENKITLTAYIEVMEDIFNALKLSNPELYMKTLDFQDFHLVTVATKLG